MIEVRNLHNGNRIGLGGSDMTLVWPSMALFFGFDILSFRFDMTWHFITTSTTHIIGHNLTISHFNNFFRTRCRRKNIWYKKSKRGSSKKINHNGRDSIQLSKNNSFGPKLFGHIILRIGYIEKSSPLQSQQKAQFQRKFSFDFPKIGYQPMIFILSI